MDWDGTDVNPQGPGARSDGSAGGVQRRDKKHRLNRLFSFPGKRKIASPPRAVMLVIMLVILASITTVFSAYELNQAFGLPVGWAILWAAIVGLFTFLANSFCAARVVVREKGFLRTLRDVYPGIIVAVIIGIMLSFAATIQLFRDQALGEWQNLPAIREVTQRTKADIENQQDIIAALVASAKKLSERNVDEDPSVKSSRAKYDDTKREYDRADADYQCALYGPCRTTSGTRLDELGGKRNRLQLDLDSAKREHEDTIQKVKIQIGIDVAQEIAKTSDPKQKKDQLSLYQEKVENNLFGATINFLLRPGQASMFFVALIVLYVSLHMLPLMFGKDDLDEIRQKRRFVHESNPPQTEGGL